VVGTVTRPATASSSASAGETAMADRQGKGIVLPDSEEKALPDRSGPGYPIGLGRGPTHHFCSQQTSVSQSIVSS